VAPQTHYCCVEEAGDVANKVSQRKWIGISIVCEENDIIIRACQYFFHLMETW
jgi:hypothetical protein